MHALSLAEQCSDKTLNPKLAQPQARLRSRVRPAMGSVSGSALDSLPASCTPAVQFRVPQTLCPELDALTLKRLHSIH